MAEKLYLPYVLVVFMVPLLARWRWGLAAALAAGVLELALVALIFYLMSIYHLFPDLNAGEAVPEHPFARIRRGQAAGAVLLMFYGAVPAAAAVAGCTLAAAWSTAAALWRAIANRGA
jgi:hypothetical protein